MASAKVQERQYHEMHCGALDQEANAHIHFGETDFEAKGFNAGPKYPTELLPNGKEAPLPKGVKKRDGMGDHYHFYGCPQLELGFVMSRRFPCGCISCRDILRLKWEKEMD